MMPSFSLAGMTPVEVHPSMQSTSRRMSEEKRLARRTGSTSSDVSRVSRILTIFNLTLLTLSLPLSRPPQGEVTSPTHDSTTTYVLESGPSDPYMSDSQDSSAAGAGDPQQPLVSVTVNTNSNNDNDSGKCVTTTSLYVAAVPSDVPTSSPCDGEGEEHSSKHEVDEIGEGTQEKQNGTSRVEIVLHNPANSTLTDSDTNKSTNSCSTANPMPNVQPSDVL